MLSKLPLIFAVTALTLAGDTVFDGGSEALPMERPAAKTIEVETKHGAGMSGSLLSWDGLGSAEALLGPATLARAGMAIEGPAGLFSPTIDGRGHFHCFDLVPGDYAVKVLWDGRVVHEHRLTLAALEGVALEIRLAEGHRGLRVAVQAIGAGQPTQQYSANEDDEEVVDVFDDSDDVLPLEGRPAPVGSILGGVPAAVDSGLAEFEEGAWAEEAVPSSLLEMLDTHMIIDPDVNVSKLHESDPLGGFGDGEIRAI